MYDEGMSTAIDDINLTLKPAAECCSLTGGLLDAEQAERVAGMLKALADPTRLRLLSHLNAQGCQEVCACDLTEELGITQPTVSHHMKKLRSEEHTYELQSRFDLVCRLLLEKKKRQYI